MAEERLQKILARAGVASRRHAEELISAGRVTVNDQRITALGTRADATRDRVTVDGVEIGPGADATGHAYYMVNKPAGYICTTRDPAGRPSVLDLLPPAPGLLTVGRLDLDTEGLLLVTDDGTWAHRISHPRFGVEKEYRALVRGVPAVAALRRLREGVEIPGGRTGPAEVRLLHNFGDRNMAEVAVVLHEGRKRQVRLMLAAVGHPVVGLERVRVGPLQLGGLPRGQHRALTPAEVQGIIKDDAGEDEIKDERQAARSMSENAAETDPQVLRDGMPETGQTLDGRRETGATTDPTATGRLLRIAIDGPAAAGKSTIGRLLAERLDILYLDTGTMYRALTWLVQVSGIAVGDEQAVTTLAETARFAYPEGSTPEQVNPPTVINDRDATAAMRTPEVDALVSIVAAYPGVRRALVRRQRALAGKRSIVMVGRDIGTVVLPDADMKVYLTAAASERARRRVEEKRAAGEEADYEAILRAIEQRDRLDSEREASPLRPAADAVMVDTTGLTVPEVVARIVEHLRRAGPRR